MRSRIYPLALAGSALFSTVSFAQDAATPPGPEEPFTELPILSWQQEMELQSTIRQVLFNAYLPFLARPTDYRGVHNDAIPNQVGDWNWMRPDVQAQLRARQDAADAQRRGHAGLPDAEINALIGKKQAFRPEELERLLTSSPRFDDLSVVIKRVQPLGPNGSGGEVYRVDFDVKTKSGAIVETTTFEAVDVVGNNGTWLLPTRVVLDVAPVARAGTTVTAGFNPVAIAGSVIEVVMSTVQKVVPFPLPELPIPGAQ